VGTIITNCCTFQQTAPITCWLEGWVGLRATLDLVEQINFCPGWELKTYSSVA